ncbi:TetR family transcriptional regulator [Spongiactinospora gelatinilytica]|uniref:TetR family transcriptional regulator n=1 Tax=Spongiactinospora gelatinilytica TaxID=2666298 RepID=A0A2W2FTX0_9ACTN|nr:TetR/AcrR family transcriptional regulator [Spongiactinospora gelatinilytica]PZG40866.1 TetR family transcriptional regulator [Spongiactinospora gelatinilytica]
MSARTAGGDKQSFIEQARRAQIVASATKVIAETRYAGASLALIAEDAGISKGVISYHFTSKSELMEEVVRRILAEVVEFVVESVKDRESATEVLRGQILAVAEHMRERPAAIMALHEIAANMRAPDGSLRSGIEASEEILRLLEGIYEMGQRTGEFRAFDCRVMAVTHNAAVNDMFAYWATHPGHDLDAHAAELADVFVRATREEPSA